MKVGTVTQKFIVSQMRLDGKFHLSDGLKVRALINKSPYGLKKIKDMCSDIYCPGIFRRHYVKSGTAFLGGGDIQKSDLDSGKYLRESSTPNYEVLQIKKGWTLVTCGGTIGDCVFANNLHAKCWASQHVMRVIPASIKEGMLYGYLASNYGKLLLCTDTYGSVIPTLNAESIGTLPIPNFPESFQQQVDELIQESAKLREEATLALNTAVSYFNDNYPIKSGVEKVFVKSLQSLNFSIAAYNNNLEVDDFTKSYRASAFQLKDVTKRIFAPPLFKHIYLDKDNGYPFMTGSELTKFNMRYYRWLSKKGVKDINDYVVNKGTLLLYKSGTTDGGILGNVFIADEVLNGCCLSDHVIRIVFDKEDYAYWTFAFLKSQGGVRLLQSLATGTMIPFITPERISDLYVPSPTAELQRINELVEKYIRLTSKSKLLENKAISMVEQEIEKWNN